jgi:hypothetical protein
MLSDDDFLSDEEEDDGMHGDDDGSDDDDDDDDDRPDGPANLGGGRFARKGTRRIAAQWRERNDDFVAVGRRATCATRQRRAAPFE